MWEDENEEATHSGRDEDLERESRSRREQVSRRPPRQPPPRPANPRNRDANATHRRRRDPTPILTDAVPFHLSPQFWSEGYREGIEEGKKATVQRGFNVGFREGAAAGVAYGQVRGAAVSVGIFAGQVPGSGGWADAVRGAAGIVQRMRPADAAREAKADHERLLRSESRDGDPGTPTRSEQVVNNGCSPSRRRIDPTGTPSARRRRSAAGARTRTGPSPGRCGAPGTSSNARVSSSATWSSGRNIPIGIQRDSRRPKSSSVTCRPAC